MNEPPSPPVVHLSGVRLRYGKTPALAGIDLKLPSGCMVGLIGPDGVGKSSLLSLITGSRAIQTGAALIREREHGTVEHLLAMPVTPWNHGWHVSARPSAPWHRF